MILTGFENPHRIWEFSKHVRIITGCEIPQRIWESSLESTQDLWILTGFDSPHRIQESTQDLRILTGFEWRIQTGFGNPVSKVFWYLKILRKPNGILIIWNGRNDDAETLCFQNKFQWVPVLSYFLSISSLYVCRIWESSQDFRILTGFENPHRIWASSQDWRILTGVENPHGIWESSQDLRIHTESEIPRRVW